MHARSGTSTFCCCCSKLALLCFSTTSILKYVALTLPLRTQPDGRSRKARRLLFRCRTRSRICEDEILFFNAQRRSRPFVGQQSFMIVDLLTALPTGRRFWYQCIGTKLQKLHGQKWKGKTLVPYLFGDYEFQTMNYGLSGSSGVRPCFHCLCTRKDM